MKPLIRLFGCFFLLLFSLAPAHAIGLIIIEDTSLPPEHWPVPRHPHFRPIHRFTPLEIKSVKVSSIIKDQVAQTRIEEEIYNPNSQRLEGTFYLPLPQGAHLEKLALEVNGKMTDAELLAADKAKSIYEEIVRKAQDPALLEYLGRDLVKVRIFPIEPHSTKRIELSYTALLKSDSGLVSYSLPLSTARHCAAPVRNLGLKLHLESSTPLKTIYSPTHNPEIKRTGERTAVIGFEQSETPSRKGFSAPLLRRKIGCRSEFAHPPQQRRGGLFYASGHSWNVRG